MTPKQKAYELIVKYYSRIEHTLSEEYDKYGNFIAQQCAVIAVDEILKMENTNTYNYLTENKEQLIVQLADSYWQEVKKEIEKL
jgi:hypothetical protein